MLNSPLSGSENMLADMAAGTTADALLVVTAEVFKGGKLGSVYSISPNTTGRSNLGRSI